LLTGLYLLLAGTVLFCQESFPVFYPAGGFPAPGRVSGLKVLQDGMGHAYVLYIEDGQFRILKADGRGALEPYQAEGLDAAIYGARQLELSGFGINQHAAFIGGTNGSEGIFVLGLDSEGALRCYPVPEIQNLGSISRYFITSSSSKGAAVFLLSEGKLSCIAGIDETGNIPVYHAITGNDEQIEGVNGLDLMADFRYPLGRGWFTLNRDEKREAVFFSLDNNFLISRKSIGLYEGDLKLLNSMNIDGDSITTLINGAAVEVYEAEGTGFSRKQAFTAPETVFRYDIPFESFGLLSAGNENTGILYGLKNTGTNAPLFETWLDSAGKNEPVLLYGNADNLCLAGRREDAWYVMYLNSQGTITGEERLEGIGAGETLFASGTSNGRFRLYFFAQDQGIITIYEKHDTDWYVRNRAELPAEIAGEEINWNEAAADHPLLLEDRLIPVNAKNGTLFFETETGRISLLENSMLHASRNINGIIYCAIHNDEKITLYRLEEAN
jgi:hypothetical protein